MLSEIEALFETNAPVIGDAADLQVKSNKRVVGVERCDRRIEPQNALAAPRQHQRLLVGRRNPQRAVRVEKGDARDRDSMLAFSTCTGLPCGMFA